VSGFEPCILMTEFVWGGKLGSENFIAYKPYNSAGGKRGLCAPLRSFNWQIVDTGVRWRHSFNN